MAHQENNFAQLAQWYVQSLETISEIFHSPLTLLHGMKMEELSLLKDKTGFSESWTCFKTHPERGLFLTDSSVLEALNLLIWNSNYVLQSVGENTANFKLPFDWNTFQIVQQTVSNTHPFNICVYGPIVFYPIGILVRNIFSSPAAYSAVLLTRLCSSLGCAAHSAVLLSRLCCSLGCAALSAVLLSRLCC